MAEELRLWPEVVQRLSVLGWIALQTGDQTRARQFCEQALRIAAEHDLQNGQFETILAVLGLGVAARRDGKLDTAETHLRQLQDLARRAGTARAPYLVVVFVELGFAAEQRGDPAAAYTLHLDAITVARQIGDPPVPGLRDRGPGCRIGHRRTPPRRRTTARRRRRGPAIGGYPAGTSRTARSQPNRDGRSRRAARRRLRSRVRPRRRPGAR
jgi:hypothetical protein